MAALEVAQPEFGSRLRDRRLELGLSQKALADSGQVTASYVSLLEKGTRVPTLDVVVGLARVLNTSIESLLGVSAAGLIGAEAGGTDGTASTLVEARQCVEAGDVERAVKLLSAARAIGGLDERRLFDIDVLLQEQLGALDRHTERLALLDELDGLALVAASHEIRLSLGVDRAVALRESGRLGAAWEVLEPLIGQVGAPPYAGSWVHVRLLGVVVSVLVERGEFEPVRAFVPEMLDHAGKLGSGGVLGRAYWAAAMASHRLGDLERTRDYLTEAHRELTHASIKLVDWLRFCRFYATALLDVGEDLDAARDWLLAAETLTKTVRLPGEWTAATALRARFELAAGDIARAAELFEEAVAQDAGLTGATLISVLLEWATALQRLGRPAEAIEVLRRAARQCERDGNYRQAAEAWRRIDDVRGTDEERR
ncbi:helix-turn-helix domain-containing protein [Amycolatopsis keratiniphila]|uniref:XRE family transcriptional regulator n=1 Tax=Amycolatopsis keratiniphila TaxID=129921 RepID=R4T6D6_9PSEU|nr:helix-turn-helix transcriptional regulator [Amycolatopsis keratiniphila]AGM07926.1 XRE family transcriptional regulator [Amycolatopsis keratiniphila]